MSRGMIKNKDVNKKNEILKAAIEIFSKKGYSDATIREIASRANVSIGAIYFYFKNKAEILKEIFKRMDHMPVEEFIKIRGNISEEKTFEEICRRALEFISRDFELVMLFFNEASKSSKLSDFFYIEFSKSVTDLSNFFKKYHKNGIFRERDQQETALLFIMATFSVVMFKDGPFKRQLKNYSYEKFVKILSDIFLNGLLSDEARPRFLKESIG